MHIYFRGGGLQRYRLLSGLVLFAFAGTHFLNHALGLVNLEVMHQVQAWRTEITRSVPGTAILLLALLTHIGFGLYKTALRHTWRMPPWEFIQIASGLAIPLLLLPHIINTRIAHTVFGVEDSYLYELKRLWPASAWQQSALLLLVWVHGCIGLHHWLRLDERYRRLRPLLVILAVAVPSLALAGFVVAGQTTADIMSDAEAMAALKARSRWPGEAASADLEQWRFLARVIFTGIAVAAILVSISLRLRLGRGSRLVRITYSGGPTVEIQQGQTLLEASRAAGVPHASVCGGRARCSTCRVRIVRGREKLPPAEGAESVTLRVIDAPADVRLACQIRPTADLTVTLVSAPGTSGPVEFEFDEVKEAVASHARAQAMSQLVQKSCGEPGELIAWFEKHLGTKVVLPACGDASGELRGGRIDYMGDKRLAVAVYALGYEDVSVFLMHDQASSSYMVRAVRHGYRVLGWADDRAHFIAVASSSRAELDRLAAIANPAMTAPQHLQSLEKLSRG